MLCLRFSFLHSKLIFDINFCRYEKFIMHKMIKHKTQKEVFVFILGETIRELDSIYFYTLFVGHPVFSVFLYYIVGGQELKRRFQRWRLTSRGSSKGQGTRPAFLTPSSTRTNSRRWRLWRRHSSSGKKSTHGSTIFTMGLEIGDRVAKNVDVIFLNKCAWIIFIHNMVNKKVAKSVCSWNLFFS